MDVLTDNNDSIEIDESIDDAIINTLVDGIENAFNSYLIEKSIEDMKQETQNVYNACLMYICFNYLKPNKHMYCKYIRGISNCGHITNEYNYNILYGIADYYIYKSLECNKIPSIAGYCFLTGITQDSIYSWAKDESQRPRATEIYKRLRFAYESGLENGAQSGKNPVGFIATLNHRFGWSADNKPQLTVNITRTKQEILSSVDKSLLTENTDKP